MNNDQTSRITNRKTLDVRAVRRARLNAQASIPSHRLIQEGRLEFSSDTLTLAAEQGAHISLYINGTWADMELSTVSLDMSAKSDGDYYVFLYYDAGTLTLEAEAVAADPTTQVERVDGVPVKIGAQYKRLVGLVLISNVNSVQTVDPAGFAGPVNQGYGDGMVLTDKGLIMELLENLLGPHPSGMDAIKIKWFKDRNPGSVGWGYAEILAYYETLGPNESFVLELSVFSDESGSNPATITLRSSNAGTSSIALDADNLSISGNTVLSGAGISYDDLQFPVAAGKVPAVNAPTWETFTTNSNEYSFAVDDYLDLSSNECPHWWKIGSAADIHLHITTKAANTSGANRYAKFTVYVAYGKPGTAWLETSFTAELTIPNGTAALTPFYLDMGNLDLTGYGLSTHIKPRVKRIAATGGTEYSGNIFINQLGAHLQKDGFGSNEETTK